MKKLLLFALLIGIILAMSFPASADITENLILWLTMDAETATNDMLFDASGKNVSATMKGSPTAVYDGAIGHAMHFNGVSYITLPNITSKDFTISFWIRTTETAPSDPQWYKGRGLFDGEVGGVTDDMGVSQIGDSVMFGVGNPDTNIKGFTAVNDGRWHHVVCTREQVSGTMAMYIDGILQGTTTANTAELRITPDLQIGDGHGYDSFVGDIDEVRVYSVVIAEEDILTLYSKEGGQDTPPTPVDRVKPIYKSAAFRKNSSSYVKKGRLAVMRIAGQEVTPVEVDGVIFVPARYIAFCFDEYASWDQSTRSVTIAVNGKSVTIRENSNEIVLQDGRTVQASAQMILTEETIVWLPVVDVMKALGLKVAVTEDLVIVSSAFAYIDDELIAQVIKRFE